MLLIVYSYQEQKGVNQHMVLNIHTRDLHTSRDSMGAVLEFLASNQDLLWPCDRWPAMIDVRRIILLCEGAGTHSTKGQVSHKSICV